MRRCVCSMLTTCFNHPIPIITFASSPICHIRTPPNNFTMDAFEDNAVPPVQEADQEIRADPFLAEEANGPSEDNFEDDAVVVESNEEAAAATATTNGLSDAMGGLNVAEGAGRPDMAASPVPTMPRIEPEVVREWRAKQEKVLEEKDAKEADAMTELKEKAEKELKDWYKKYEEQLEKTKSDNRAEEKTYIAKTDAIEPGTEWERVNNLCEFNSKNSKNSKDMTRMRSILLQLKQNPKPVKLEM